MITTLGKNKGLKIDGPALILVEPHRGKLRIRVIVTKDVAIEFVRTGVQEPEDAGRQREQPRAGVQDS